MIIYYFVLFLNILIGLVIPFKQYNKGLFIYFLVSGIADPISVILFSLFSANTNILIYCYNIISFIITVYYIKRERINPFYVITIAVFIGITPFLCFDVLIDSLTQNGMSLIIGLSAIIGIFITYNFLVLMSRNILPSGKVNVYFLVLVLSGILTILKLGVLAIKLQVGIAYFVISFFFEAVIGIYFIFFDIKNSPQIPLAGKKANAEAVES